MEVCSRNGDGCPQLLELLQKERREWVVKREEAEEQEETIYGVSDQKKLELSLGPPGGGNWTMKDNSDGGNGDHGNKNSLLSFGYFSNPNSNTNTISNHKFRSSSPWSSSAYQVKQSKGSSLLHVQSSPRQGLAVTPKESSQPCYNKVVGDMQQIAEKKGFSLTAAATNTAVTNSAQKRTAPAPVVGWPPVRSFRKNLASSSSLKAASESPNNVVCKKPTENSQRKGQFVKINMDGIPIGRKVDLSVYDSYERLSSAVDQLFRGLLAAQSDSSGGGIENKDEVKKVITGLLDGSGEYTLVYEDNEGDRMLVGDVPWHMFVSAVKRLRVLKTSELAMFCRGAKQGKLSLDS